MEAGRVGRKLSAILAADIAGYSRLMGSDEEGTLRTLAGLRRNLVDPAIARHRGRIVKNTGDGLLAEFVSVVDAVRSALEMQTGIALWNAAVESGRRLEFRIGINVGDIVYQDGDIFGDSVNIAARLEGLAEPGGICVSARVQEDTDGRVDVRFEDIGFQSLKNIVRPVHVYRVRAPVAGAAAPVLLALPDRPSIAVLPFQNMSGDSEQDYFADGMVEDITTALSRIRWLFVIARNSSFTYKGRSVEVKQIGRELGVRYVLEGSVRKSGDRVRISGQLIDASTGAHLWAERFDGELSDIFGLQDRVTASVVGTIAPRLEQAEIERAKRKPTESLDAYDYFLRGMAAFHEFTPATHEVALALFGRAMALDPSFASSYGMAARRYLQRLGYGWSKDRALEAVEAERLARRAAELGKDDAVVLCSAGLALAVVANELDDGVDMIERAVALNPNLAWAWLSSAVVKGFTGEPEAAIEHAARAMRLSPQDLQIFAMQMATALGHFFAGRDAEAFSWAALSVRTQSNFFLANCVAAASGALAGRRADAEKAMARIRQINPSLRLSNLHSLFPIRRPEDFARWAEGLRLAGLPA
jgi:adenylate cyclase